MKALILLFCICPFWSSAQYLSQGWERNYAPHGDDALEAVIEATNGYLVTVGGTRDAKGQFGLLSIIDPGSGQVRTEKRLGLGTGGKFFGAAQTFEGYFILAGYTETGGKNKRDAWLMTVDERGNKVREQAFGDKGDDEFRFVQTLPDGIVLLGGYRDKDVWVAKSEDGMAMAWDARFSKDEFASITGMVATADGGIVFCGDTGKDAPSGTGYIYVAKVDSKGKTAWKKFFGDKGWNEAGKIARTSDGGFALVGGTRTKGAGEMDAWLIKINREGFRQWDRTYGGKGADRAYDLLQNNDGYLLVGATKSYRSGARNHATYIAQTTIGGDLLWEMDAGSDRDDALTHLLQLHNGNYAMSGRTASNTWLRHMTPTSGTRYSLAGVRDLSGIQISEINLRSADGTLKPNQQTAITFSLTNASGIDLPDVRVLADKRTTHADVYAWGTNHIGTLRKDETVIVSIPVKGNPEMLEGNCEFSLSVTADDKTVKTLNKTITMKQLRPASLGLKNPQFIPSATSDAITLKVELVNTGDEGTGATMAQFFAPPGLSVSSGASHILGTVGPHASRELTFVFTKTPQFTASSADIVCSVKENDQEKVRKSLTWQAAGRGVASGPIMIWTDPAPHETGSNKVRTSDNHFEFKMTVSSPNQLAPQSFKMKVNGVEMEGSKFSEEDLSPPKLENTRYTYTYKNKVPLVQGINNVQVLLDGESSEALEVTFAPRRANLHLLTIGPQHNDLKYTAKDAADIAATFANQGGEDKLFDQVLSYNLSTPEVTDITGIKQAFLDLAYLWNDKQINSNDVLMVFISSHGKIYNDRFKILQSGYNPRYETITVDFKTDVLDVLAPVSCKKLIFIDACHSGGAKDGLGVLSQAIVDLAKAQPGVTTISSSSSTEKSYEDSSWGNGAFTKAILEATSDQPCTDENGQYYADSDRDGILKLGELYTFLRRRVPDLVKRTLPNAPTSQTPFMPENQLDAGLPIYLINK